MNKFVLNGSNKSTTLRTAQVPGKEAIWLPPSRSWLKSEPVTLFQKFKATDSRSGSFSSRQNIRSLGMMGEPYHTTTLRLAQPACEWGKGWYERVRLLGEQRGRVAIWLPPSLTPRAKSNDIVSMEQVRAPEALVAHQGSFTSCLRPWEVMKQEEDSVVRIVYINGKSG